MINQDFGKFIKAQEKHKSTYLGGGNTKRDKNDQDRKTDISVGAEGRDISKKDH